LKILNANRIAALAESIRPFHCYDCISQMANPPPVHMHGSNLLVRADVEDKVGWDHSETVAEDQLFGVKVHDQYGSVFGWHGGILLEQPPLYLRDHFRQRSRWVTGTLQNLKYLPMKMRFRIYFKVSTYWLGFLSAVASITMYTYYFLANAIGLLMHMANIEYAQPRISSLPIATPESIALALQRGAKFSLVWQDLISLVMGVSLLASFAIWLLSYQIGLHQTLRNSEMKGSKKALLHLEQLLLSPIIGLVETMPAFYAILKFYVCPKPFRDFHVISK
jgi:cellulose synthase/poly-beta-1,6-N-acetylglucosamine synthase-like glycosyltransferase